MQHAVLFDLDGTLLDTEPDFTFILNELLRYHGRPVVSAEHLRKLVSAGATTMVRHGFEMQESDPLLPALLTQFLDMYADLIPSTQAGLYSDVDLLLASLNDQGIPWGIMTNKSRRFSVPLLARFESFATCATLVCPDDVGKGKPDPAGLLLACEQLAVEPANAIYVGDHPRDIEAANNAGMPGVAVSWGYLPENNPIEQWKAFATIHSPLELLQILSGSK
ncbi:MAG: HAD-IA family hydrolase [Pseudomonadota bacterium]